MHRRTLLAAPLAAPCVMAYAQDTWPARPIRLVLGYPPGGSVDAIARLLQPGLQRLLNVPVVIENRGGAAGAIGTAEAARAAPDGHTWTILFSPQALNEAVMPRVAFDIRRDFAVATLIGTGPMVLAAGLDAPFRDMAQLAAAARRQPDGIPYATGGIGTLEHVSMVLLQDIGGFRMSHIPYRGGGPALQALLSRDVPVCMSNLPIAAPHLAAGAIRALGLTTPGESPHLPGVPGLASLGFPGFEALNWWILAAPARTPPGVQERMHAVVAALLADPATRARVEALGVDVIAGDPDQASRFLLAEADKWGRIAREHRISVDG